MGYLLTTLGILILLGVLLWFISQSGGRGRRTNPDDARKEKPVMNAPQEEFIEPDARPSVETHESDADRGPR